MPAMNADVVPDAIQPVVGWKVWRVLPGGLLGSAAFPTLWQPGTTTVARCCATQPTPHPRGAPDAACGAKCGIYLAASWELARRYRHAGAVVGLAAGWGRLLECALPGVPADTTSGWRAELAAPLVLRAGSGASCHLLARVAERYRLPLLGIDVPAAAALEAAHAAVAAFTPPPVPASTPPGDPVTVRVAVNLTVGVGPDRPAINDRLTPAAHAELARLIGAQLAGGTVRARLGAQLGRLADGPPLRVHADTALVAPGWDRQLRRAQLRLKQETSAELTGGACVRLVVDVTGPAIPTRLLATYYTPAANRAARAAIPASGQVRVEVDDEPAQPVTHRVHAHHRAGERR